MSRLTEGNVNKNQSHAKMKPVLSFGPFLCLEVKRFEIYGGFAINASNKSLSIVKRTKLVQKGGEHLRDIRRVPFLPIRNLLTVIFPATKIRR